MEISFFEHSELLMQNKKIYCFGTVTDSVVASSPPNIFRFTKFLLFRSKF